MENTGMTKEDYLLISSLVHTVARAMLCCIHEMLVAQSHNEVYTRIALNVGLENLKKIDISEEDLDNL